MWLLIKNMHENILEMVKQKKHTHIMQSGEKLCHPGHALDLKTKDFIHPDQSPLIISQS